jgi:CDP-diacylglycerol--glycerol-3-phosphate 3-phosphatidyltransferase
MKAPRPPGFAADLATPPNIITLSRIGLLLAAAAVFFAGYEKTGTVVAIVAGVTDYLDGWLARRTGRVTRLGELLDQFCDTIYESLVLYLIIARFHFLPLWVMPVYLGREFWVTTIRRFMAGHQLNIATNLLGKMKTNFVMWGFLPAFLSIERLFPGAEPAVRHFGQGAIVTGIGLGYASAWGYTRALISGYDELSVRPAPVPGRGTAEPGAWKPLVNNR